MFVLHVNDRLMLRMLSARDAEPLFHLIDQSRDHLKTWLPWIDDTENVDDTMDFIKGSFDLYNNKQGIISGIFYDETLVGVIAFNKFNWSAKIGSIGYWLATHATGKGIMTTAVTALLTYGFIELDLNRIEIRVAEQNIASRAIPEKLNFLQEGKLRDAEWLNNHYVDHIVYSILKREWNLADL